MMEEVRCEMYINTKMKDCMAQRFNRQESGGLHRLKSGFTACKAPALSKEENTCFRSHDYAVSACTYMICRMSTKNSPSLPKSLEKPLYKGCSARERCFGSLPYLSHNPPIDIGKRGWTFIGGMTGEIRDR